MKLVIVTGENDTYNYPADCVIQGQISNIKLKEVLQNLANGSSFVKNDSWEHESTTKGEDSQLPTRITFDRNVVDKLSTRKSNKPLFRKSKIHFNPLVLADIVAGAIALFVIILIICFPLRYPALSRGDTKQLSLKRNVRRKLIAR